jgi:hypothetical protein
MGSEQGRKRSKAAESKAGQQAKEAGNTPEEGETGRREGGHEEEEQEAEGGRRGERGEWWGEVGDTDADEGAVGQDDGERQGREAGGGSEGGGGKGKRQSGEAEPQGTREFHESRRQTYQTGGNWKKRVWYKRDEMLKRMPEGAFPVAVDNESGGKKFTFFETHEAFFRETAVEEQKNFYEMIKPDAWCRAYFDIEFYEKEPGGDGGIDEIIQTIEEAMCRMWREEMESRGETEIKKEVLIASRHDTTANRFKHSYHVIFPEIYCEGNNDRLKDLVKTLGENPQLHRRGKAGQPMCAIDGNVYSKWQNFRMVESCKKTEEWSLGRDVGTLRWRDQGVRNMTSLLRTVISRDGGGGVQVAKRDQTDEKMGSERALLQALRVDGMTVTSRGCRAWGIGICPGSGKRHEGLLLMADGRKGCEEKTGVQSGNRV